MSSNYQAKNYAKTWNKSQVDVQLNQSTTNSPMFPDTRYPSNHKYVSDSRPHSRSLSRDHYRSSRMHIPEKIGNNDDVDISNQLYELNNSQAFKPMVEEVATNPEFKNAYIEEHGSYLKDVAGLNAKLATLKRDNEELSNSLALKNSDLDFAKTKLSRLQEEHNQVKTELDKAKAFDKDRDQTRKEVDAKLAEFQQKYYETERRLTEVSQESVFMKNALNQLEVDQKHKEGYVLQMETQIQHLEKCLSIHDTSLAQKTKMYDNKFFEIEKQHQKVQQLATSTQNIYDNISANQTLQASRVQQLDNSVASINNTVNNLEDTIERIREGPLQCIESNMVAIRKCIVEDLALEIDRTKEKRIELYNQHTKMSYEYQDVKTNLKSYYKDHSNELSKLKVTRLEYLREFLPLFAVIGLLLALIIVYLILTTGKSQNY